MSTPASSSSYPISPSSTETEPAAYGVGTASSKLVDRKAGSPTGAWRPGDEPGHRRFLEIGDLPLESGEVLPNTVLAFETWGELSPQRDNAVLVLHALTGDSHVTGEAGPGHPTPGWWSDLVGPGRAIDTERYFVVAANILGGCQPAARIDQPLVQDGDLPIGTLVAVPCHDAVDAPVLGQRLLGTVQIGLELRQPLVQPLVSLTGGRITGVHVSPDEGCRHLVDDGRRQLRVLRLERDLHQRPLVHLHHLQVVVEVVERPLFQLVLGGRLLGRPGRADVGNEVLQRAGGHELGARREVQVADDTQRHIRGLQEFGRTVLHRHVGQAAAHILNGHGALGGLEGDGRGRLIDRRGAQAHPEAVAREAEQGGIADTGDSSEVRLGCRRC